MTNHEALIYLDNIGELLEYVTHKDYLPPYREALTIAKDALKNKSEAERYRIPQKVSVETRTGRYGYCPLCERICDQTNNFCTNCGQALDWL